MPGCCGQIGDKRAQPRTLRSRLGLDSGYLSRLLRALQTDGLVAVEADPDDQRVPKARSTRAGRAELDRRSDELVATILAPLNDCQRNRQYAQLCVPLGGKLNTAC